MINHDSDSASLDDSRLQESDQNGALPDAGGTDDLDALLAQFDAETTRPAAANGHDENAVDAPHNGEHANGDAGKTLEDYISDAELAERQQRTRAYYASLQLDQKINTIKEHEYQKDLSATVANVRGDLDVKDSVTMAWLDARVREDKALEQAWLGRADDPKTWKAAERVLIKTFYQEFSRQPDPNMTADMAMVAAAIKGASVPAQTEPAPNYSRMSNPELRDEMRRLGINPTF